MNELRDRIAAALYKAGDNRISPGMCRQQADAVIRELQLTVLGDGIVVGVIHE